jgi:hypothetical protein
MRHLNACVSACARINAVAQVFTALHILRGVTMYSIQFNSNSCRASSWPARLRFTIPSQAAAACYALHRLIHPRLVLRASGCSPPQPPATGARGARFESGDDGMPIMVSEIARGGCDDF